MRIRLALSLLALLFALVGGCSQQSDPGGAFLSLSLTLPTGAVNITSVTVAIRDQNASCNGADVQGGNELVRQMVNVSESAHIEVSAGQRVVSAVANDGATAVARGCMPVTVTAGGTTPVQIQLAEYPPGIDGPPDGPPADGPPDGGPPGGDDCDNPDTVGVGGSIMRTAVGANDSITPSCGAAGAGDLFFTFTLVSPSNVDLRLDDTTGTHALAVYSGGCGSLAEVACANAADPDVLTDVPLAAGTYFAVVEEETVGSAGTFSLMVTATAVPPKDGCANPGILTLNVAGAGGNYGGVADDAAGSCGGAGQPDQVHLLNVPDVQYVRVAANGSGSFATYVRDECTVAGSEVGTPICDGTSPGQIDLSLAQGDYYVWVDRTGGGNSAYTLSATTQAPPNDVCPGTTIATGDTIGTLIGANNTAPAPSCGGTGNDVFYTFTLAANAHLVATVTATDAATNPSVSLRSTCTDAATELGCANTLTGATETLDIATVNAGTYFLVIDSNGAASSFTVNLQLTTL